MNFPSIARCLMQPLVAGLGGSTCVHGIAVGVIIYLLLAAPSFLWEVDIRRGEAVVIQAQMAAVAATQPEVVKEVEVSIEPAPLEPPPPVSVEHTPVRETLEPVPAAIPVVRVGEYEPTEAPPQVKPPESPAPIELATKTPRREATRQETPPTTAVLRQLADRAVADIVRDSPSKINATASAPTIAGAQVDEMPRKLANNREPHYPVEALRAGIEGRVVLRIEISADGRATNIMIETSSGLTSFDESAIAAVREWRFSPARRKGLAVAHEVLVPIRFRIQRG